MVSTSSVSGLPGIELAENPRDLERIQVLIRGKGYPTPKKGGSRPVANPACAGTATKGGGRQSMGDRLFVEILRPERQISSNCQSPVVCLSPCRSIWEYIPRYILLNPGIHSEVLARSGNTFRGSPLLEEAHAGFASVGAQTPLISLSGEAVGTSWRPPSTQTRCQPKLQLCHRAGRRDLSQLDL